MKFNKTLEELKDNTTNKTMTDYKQKYEEALAKAKDFLKANDTNIICEQFISIVKDIFPELKESKDERTKRLLLEMFKNFLPDVFNRYGLGKDVAIAWLEKQGKSAQQAVNEEKVDNANKVVRTVATS